MLCHKSPTPDSSQPKEGSELTEASLPSKKNLFRSIALAGGLAIAPHTLCILGVTGVLSSVVGYKICSDHSSTDFDIPLKKLPKLPEDFNEFPTAKSELVGKLLLQVEPKFQDVIDFKQAESKDEPIKIVFLEDKIDGKVSVVFCKNGGLCPCSKPELYEIGFKDRRSETESFKGQNKILSELYKVN